MKTFTVAEAKQNLDQILEFAKQGGTAFIVGEDNEAYQLVATFVPEKGPRKAGRLKGKITISDDFDEPLPEFKPYME